MNIAFVISSIYTACKRLGGSLFFILLFVTFHFVSNGSPLSSEPKTVNYRQSNISSNILHNRSQKSQTVYTENYFRDFVNVPQLDITLYKHAGGALFAATDSVRLNFEDFYNNNIDTADAVKSIFPQSSLAILKYGILLAAEKRKKLQVSDSIFLKIGNVGLAIYRLAIDPSVLVNPQMQAFIKDNYLQTETTVSLNNVTNIDFTVNTDAASAAGNRFYIFFRPYIVAGALPVTFIYMQAAPNENKTNAVRWKVAIELNLHHYETETSTNGSNFTRFGSNVFSTGNGNAAFYEQTDFTPAKGLVYYRIKAVSTTGQSVYSNITRLNAIDKYQPIQVYPNPIVNKQLNVVFNDRAGLYSFMIVNQQGKTVETGQLKVAKNLQQKIIVLNSALAAGRYELVLISEQGEKKNIAIMLL